MAISGRRGCEREKLICLLHYCARGLGRSLSGGKIQRKGWSAAVLVREGESRGRTSGRGVSNSETGFHLTGFERRDGTSMHEEEGMREGF